MPVESFDNKTANAKSIKMICTVAHFSIYPVITTLILKQKFQFSLARMKPCKLLSNREM